MWSHLIINAVVLVKFVLRSLFRLIVFIFKNKTFSAQISRKGLFKVNSQENQNSPPKMQNSWGP